MRYDAIVVGLGAAGSATLYHLAKQGLRVLGLEAQRQVAHDQGSSHGGSRIIRMVYQEHPSYVSWLKRSYDLWRRLEDEENQHLLVTTGCLNASTERAVGAHGHSCYQGAVESAELHNLPHTKLTAAEVNDQFPAFSFPENFKALHDPAGGFIYPERAIEAFVSGAIKHGAEVVCNSPVSNWKSVSLKREEEAEEKNSGGAAGSGSGGGEEEEVLVVETNAGQKYETQRLVLTAGAWMSHLVPELATVLSIERQVVGWFGPPADDEEKKTQANTNHFAPDNCPVFLIDDNDGYFYGFPADEKYNNLIKIGKYNHLNQYVSVVESLDRNVHPEDEAALRTCFQNYMPRLGDAPMQKSSVCMFTKTPDGHFILDYHPKYRPEKLQNNEKRRWPVVVLGSACSGHGFKFAPVLGEIIGNLAMQDTADSVEIGLEGLEMHTLDGNRGVKFKNALNLFSQN